MTSIIFYTGYITLFFWILLIFLKLYVHYKLNKKILNDFFILSSLRNIKNIIEIVLPIPLGEKQTQQHIDLNLLIQIIKYLSFIIVSGFVLYLIFNIILIQR